MNSARGYLAEFLVARAVGFGDVRRIGWDAYDLLVDGWIRVGVKSSASLQVWEQRRLSRIEFSGFAARGTTRGTATTRADGSSTRMYRCSAGRPRRTTMPTIRSTSVSGSSTCSAKATSRRVG
ncbi:hypothetical protein [Glaciihabitans sp. UYNi722]|uniref:hypothetical protein n=1 Tax=Glaciihabitans sp. UYNi722 TaxID=3156344 RepID=UPI0033936868